MISEPLSLPSAQASFAEAPDQVVLPLSPEKDFLDELEQHRASGMANVFIDLHPIEKNFFLGIQGTRASRLLVLEYYDRYKEQGERSAMEWLNQQFQSLSIYPELKKNSSSRFAFLKTSVDRIKFFQGSKYDYYRELVRQYQFVKNQQPDCSRWMYTIQGLHALGIGYPEDDYLREGETPRNASIATLRSRIRQLKGEEPIEGTADFWEHTPFAIALAGNFHNTLCGQAGSLPEISKLIYDQRRGKDLGFLKEAAADIIREILGLDTDMTKNGSNRILIDVRHMSPAARKLYYQTIITRFNGIPANQENLIPIIATQVGFSGIDSLDELSRNASEGKEKDQFRSKGFLAWSYNLCDEDVIAIFNSSGLINIANDRRILGEDYRNWLAHLDFKPVARRRGHQLIKRTIEQFVRIAFDYFLPNPLKIWDVLSFHPAVSPTQATPVHTALPWETLEEELLIILSALKREEPLWFGSFRPEDIVQKMCYSNLERIVKQSHY